VSVARTSHQSQARNKGKGLSRKVKNCMSHRSCGLSGYLPWTEIRRRSWGSYKKADRRGGGANEKGRSTISNEWYDLILGPTKQPASIHGNKGARGAGESRLSKPDRKERRKDTENRIGRQKTGIKGSKRSPAAEIADNLPLITWLYCWAGIQGEGGEQVHSCINTRTWQRVKRPDHPGTVWSCNYLIERGRRESQGVWKKKKKRTHTSTLGDLSNPSGGRQQSEY